MLPCQSETDETIRRPSDTSTAEPALLPPPVECLPQNRYRELPPFARLWGLRSNMDFGILMIVCPFWDTTLDHEVRHEHTPSYLDRNHAGNSLCLPVRLRPATPRRRRRSGRETASQRSDFE